MKANKVLFITQEITPFVPESTIANNCRNLLQNLYDLWKNSSQDGGKELRVFMPKWGTINIRRHQLHEVQRLSGMNLIIDDTDHPLIIRVASLQSARIQVYFIENDDYFPTRLTVGEQSAESDNDERTIFFNRGVLETVKKSNWRPDIIHCHGWMSALVPLYVKSAYKDEPSFRDSKIVISLYDEELSAPFPEGFLQKVLHKDMSMELLEGIASPTTYTDLAKLAIKYCDGVIIDGENISEELIAYASSIGKPILPKCTTEEQTEACKEFYEKLF